MFAYLVRKIAYGGLTVLGVLALLFVLFFTVTDPDDIARRAVGDKASQEVYDIWKRNHGYDKPLVLNDTHPVLSVERYSDTLLFEHYRRMLTFQFGRSDADDAEIAQRIREGVGPSLSLTLPLFVVGIAFGVGLSLFVAFFRGTYIDRMGTIVCVVAMSFATLIYIIGGQYVIGKTLRWFPISGYDSSPLLIWRFLALPLVVGLMSEIGSEVRFYRTVFLEETTRDYVRTARAKGCGEGRIMWGHVLRNAMLPILTSVVLQIPFLFTGALLLENFFGIPGLGAMTVEAIQGNDFSTLRTMVFIGALAFIVGQILTDVSYTLADPRVRLG
jgi:peptide/nickel transport system permease protein